MKALITTLILLAIGIWLGILVHNDSGLVLIAYQNWSAQMSLWVALCGAIIGFVVLYFALRFIAGVFNLSHRFRLWSGGHRMKKAQAQTQQGLCQLAKGDWKKALDTLLKSVKDYPSPIINYLASARAAQEILDYELRDKLLKKAAETSPRAELAIGLTQAQLQMSANQWEQALATLTHMRDIDPKHNYTLKLLQHVYLEIQDWLALEKLLPMLKKQQVLTQNQYTSLEIRVYTNRINTAASSDLSMLWSKAPKSIKANISLVQAYIDRLICKNDMNNAWKLLESTLKKSWHADLLLCFYELNLDDLAPALKFCEQALKMHPNEEKLLLALGCLCQKMQLWGKARDYLQASIAINSSALAYYNLGLVLHELNESDSASDAFKQGLHSCLY